MTTSSRPLRRLCTAAAALVMAALGASSVSADPPRDPPHPPGAVIENIVEPDTLPSYLEKEVEFMWIEDGRRWTDRFTARLYPRVPLIDQRARINLRIRRYRDGRVRGSAAPVKIEAIVRRTDGGGMDHYEIQRPGTSVSFDHVFERPGSYVVSLITHYTEEETYTVALRFDVLREPPPAVDAAEASARRP